MAWASNKHNSPAFLLAKDGFDVWVSNSRGSSYSRLHKFLDPDHDPEYWDFCFHEMAEYDTKAIIELILKNNKHRY